MHKALTGLPTFDADAFLWRIRDWKPLLAGPGNNRIVVEWCTNLGPKCFVYPAARRAVGFDLAAGSGDGHTDERWADFLEFTYVPQVVAALQGAGLPAQVICADQRPIQIQRERRRARDGAATH